MGNSEKNKRRYWPDKSASYPLIENKSVLMTLPEERFEHWGCLVYSELISGLINLVLINREKISEN